MAILLGINETQAPIRASIIPKSFIGKSNRALPHIFSICRKFAFKAMRCSVFASLICLTFTFASAAKRSIPERMAAEKHQYVIATLTEMWAIPRNKIEACVVKTKVTYDDFMVLQEFIDDQQAEDKDAVRRASCTLVCCAQAQGTMSGANIDMDAVHNLIVNSSPPNRVKPMIHVAVDTCAELVKDISDACDTFLQFILCLADDKWDMNNY